MAQKVVLITGCSSGIGLSTAVRIAKDTAKKCIVYSTMRNLKRKGPLEEAAGSALNDTMFIRSLDVNDDRSVSDAVQNIVDEHGRVDVVVNNAGIACSNPIEYLSMEKAQEVFNTNFFGTLRVIKAVLPTMKERKSGQIVNVSSISGLLGIPFYDIYSASKFAMEGLTESLAVRMEAFNIRVTAINPGAVATDFLTGMADNITLAKVEDLDETTREQYMNLRTHVRYHFKAKDGRQHTDEIADVIQGLLKIPEGERAPVRLPTSEYARGMLARKQADVDFQEGLKHQRYLIYHRNDGSLFGKDEQPLRRAIHDQ